VATWNIRSGHGVSGLLGNAPFDMNTKNCADASLPRNSWGVGFTQRFLQSEVGSDAEVVALGLQEAWGACGNVRNIAALLGWKAYTPERNGVGMIARHGIAGAWDHVRIDTKGIDGAKEDRWLVGGRICLVADCGQTMYMWTTHLAPATETGWPAHVGRMLAWLADKPRPHLFMGDLNLWQNDRWSPRTRCGDPTPSMGPALEKIVHAGYIDAWAATQQGPGWTGMTSRRGCGTDRNGGVYKRIDYIWSIGVRPIATTRLGIVPPGAPAPSDHLGLKAQFPLPR
jgi:endonuclease/exonuclease/phosphatase family metal-dependent hydrolase